MRRILCLTSCYPHPPTNGGAQRTALLLRALSAVGHTDLIYVTPYGTPRHLPSDEVRQRYNILDSVLPRARGAHGLWRAVRPFGSAFVDSAADILGTPAMRYRGDPQVSEVVQRTLRRNRYDVIISRYLWPAAMAGVLQCPPGIPVIVDLDDVDHLVAGEMSHVSVPPLKRLIFGRRLSSIRKVVPPLISAASHLWIAAAEDGRTLERGRWSLLPNIPYNDCAFGNGVCPPARESFSILMVGSAYFGPNKEGIWHFVTRIWKKVRQAVPHATLRIVASGMNERQGERWSSIPGVQAVGYVEDLRTEYSRSAFCIAPIYRGGGSKIKTIECFSFGRTCVVTPHSHRGVNDALRHRECLWRAETDDDFARGCIHLLTTPTDRDAWAEKGHDIVKTRYSFNQFKTVVHEALSRVVA